MKFSSLADILWGHRAKWQYLFIASLILLTTFLGAREIWTQEHRWADIVLGMFYRHDFLHPYLGETYYYDKPLLSYWLIASIAALTGDFTTWALRLPSALAGLLAIWSIYRIGCQVKNPSLGLLSGWLLLTTYFFVFWARTSSADMLNLAGGLFAVSWYLDKRHCARFIDFVVFFMVLALTSLCKGLAVVPLFAVLVDIALQKSWKKFLRPAVFLAALPALFVYILPFWASHFFGGDVNGQSGLYLVYKENLLRYFQPFDHQGPIYTYFLFLPIYLLPWTLFFIPALFTLKSRWSTMPLSSKWLVWTLCCLFVFFTLSGSRRSYYVLPMVPYAVCLTADWLMSNHAAFKARSQYTAAIVLTAFITFLLALAIVPAWYYSQVGVDRFANVLKDAAQQIKPWSSWQVVMLDAENKLNFYLQLPPHTPHYHIKGDERRQQTAETLEKAWPILKDKPAHTIFISRAQYESQLQGFFKDYRMITMPPVSHWLSKKRASPNTPIAFIPRE